MTAIMNGNFRQDLTDKFLEIASGGTVQELKDHINEEEDEWMSDDGEYDCVSDTNSEGQNALHLAFHFNKKQDVAVYLFKLGVSLTYRDEKSCTPIHYAAKYLRNNFFEEILTEDNETIRKVLMKTDNNGGNVLHYTCGEGKILDDAYLFDDSFDEEYHYRTTEEDKENMYKIISKIKSFLSSDDFLHLLNSSESNEYTPLHGAFKRKCLKVVALLCSLGARLPDDFVIECARNHNSDQIKQRKPDQISILSWYLWRSIPDYLDFDKCLNLKTTEDEFAILPDHLREALVYCARISYPSCQTDFDTEFKRLGINNTGRANKRIACARALLEHCSHRMGKYENVYKQQALEEAIESRFWPLVRVLVQYGARLNTFWCSTAGLLHWYVDKKLRGVDTNLKEKSIKDIVDEFDINVNEKDEKGQTPLHFIAFPYPNSCIREEFSKGTPTDTAQKKRILSSNVYMAQSDRYFMCKELIQLGANVDATDEMGFTPLMRAVENDFRDLTALFLENGANPYHSAGGMDAFILAQSHPEKATMYHAILRKDMQKELLDETLLSRSRQLLRQVMKTFDKDKISDESLADYQQVEYAYKALDRLSAKKRTAHEILDLQKERIYDLIGHHVEQVLEKLKEESVLTEIQKNGFLNSPDPCEALLLTLPCLHPDAFHKFLKILEEDLGGADLTSNMLHSYHQRLPVT